MKISPARKTAYETLFKIEKESAFSSILLTNSEENLEKKDRSLCHEIVLGTLRKKLYIDEIIKKFINKKLNKLDLEVLIALRIGIYQLLFLDKIPSYSAINESVNLVKFAKKKSASGMVNAVLRKVSKGNIKLDIKDEVEKISILTSHPKWLIEKWIKQFGFDETKNIAETNNKQPKLSFRLTKKFSDQETSKQQDILEFIAQNAEVSEFLEKSFTANKINIDFKELAQKGFIYFQDEGSQIIAESVELKANESFFDVCASPGSKTTYIGKNHIENSENKIFVSGDVYEHRLKTLKENCVNQNVSFVDFAIYDARHHLPFAEECFDVVLIDAPCSGTGTIRSNPEIRYNLSENDISILSRKQLAMLQNASKTIKQKGRLIYSTCSIEVEENESVINSFLQMNSDFELLKPNINERFISQNNFARTFPHIDKMDGFFIAVLARI